MLKPFHLIFAALLLAGCTTPAKPPSAPAITEPPGPAVPAPVVSAPSVPKGIPDAEPIGACRPPNDPKLLSAPPGKPSVFTQWSLDQNGSVLVDHADTARDPRFSPLDPVAVPVSAGEVRLTLHYHGNLPERRQLDGGLGLSGGAKGSCRWEDNYTLTIDVKGLQVNKPVYITTMMTGLDRDVEAMQLVREDRPTVTVVADGKPVQVRGEESPVFLPFGPSGVTLRFDRPMDRANVEALLVKNAVRLAPGYNGRPKDQGGQAVLSAITPAISWASDTELRLEPAQPSGGRFRIALSGLPDREGRTTLSGPLALVVPTAGLAWLDARPDAAPEKAGYLPDFLQGMQRNPELAPDGKALLLHEYLETDFAPEYRPWLWLNGGLVRLPDKFYIGDTYVTGLLPGGQGAVVVDSQRVYHYSPGGTRRIVWDNGGLIHGAAVAPKTGRLALFLHGEGDDVLLKIIDPAAPEPLQTLEDHGVVYQSKLNLRATEVSTHERITAGWSPDEHEIAWGGGNWTRLPDSKDQWRAVTYRYSPADRQPPRKIDGAEFVAWAPDGRHFLATSSYVAHKDGPPPQALVFDQAGTEVLQLGSTGWHWGGPALLWRPQPFEWAGLDGARASGPIGWRPIGWAGGRFLAVSVPTH